MLGNDQGVGPLSMKRIECLSRVGSVGRMSCFFAGAHAHSPADRFASPALFQTGWFVESVLTQALIIHVIRTAKKPFIESWASPPLIILTLVICSIAIALPYSPLAAALGFQPLPPLYWPIIASFLISYAVLATIVKTWFIRRWGM
jgi:P-type Mg2+ transporter